MTRPCTIYIKTRFPDLYPHRLMDRLRKVLYVELSPYDAVRGHLEVRCEVLPALLSVRDILSADKAVPGSCVDTYWFDTALAQGLRKL
jgi:hypothetical protein